MIRTIDSTFKFKMPVFSVTVYSHEQILVAVLDVDKIWSLHLAVDSSQGSLGLAPPGQGSVLGEVFHVDSIVLEATIGLHLCVLLPGPLSEPVVLAHEDLLTAGELELGAPQSLDDVSLEYLTLL